MVWAEEQQSMSTEDKGAYFGFGNSWWEIVILFVVSPLLKHWATSVCGVAIIRGAINSRGWSASIVLIFNYWAVFVP